MVASLAVTTSRTVNVLPAGNPVIARVTGNLITPSIETMLAAAAAGVGLVLTGPFLVADLLASGALVPSWHATRLPEHLRASTSCR